MPRPPAKRRRHNSQVRGFVLRSPARGPRIPDQNKAKEDHERKISRKPTGSRPDDSDDSEELVTTRKSGASRSRRKLEIYASGAVAKGDTPGRYPDRSRRSRSLREDTEEILSQRSRSASRATSESPVDGQPQKKQTTTKKSNEAAPTKKTTSSLVPATTASVPRKPLTNGIMNTPMAETSVLGKIKPRKRQASILQLIENEHDSTSFMSDDLSGFLPDDISTPVAVTQNKVPATNGTSSLKRKRISMNTQGAPVISPAATVAVQDALSPPSRTQQRKLGISRPLMQPQEEDDDVMAPPASSDLEDEAADSAPAPMPMVRRAQRNTKATRVAAPSTEQLQSLMPSKKHKSPGKTKKPRYDMLDDTDQASEDENEVSSFMPGRSKNTAKRGQAVKAVKAVKTTKPAAKKAAASDKPTRHTKSTRTTSFTPSASMDKRTPRPLDASLKGTQAKSPSKQEPSRAMQDKSTNPVPSVRRGVKKQYGGSRERRLDAAAGKENQPVLLSDASSGSEQQRLPIKSTEEVKAWSKKWAGIDDFEMDFETVTASTVSSSPMAR